MQKITILLGILIIFGSASLSAMQPESRLGTLQAERKNAIMSTMWRMTPIDFDSIKINKGWEYLKNKESFVAKQPGLYKIIYKVYAKKSEGGLAELRPAASVGVDVIATLNDKEIPESKSSMVLTTGHTPINKSFETRINANDQLALKFSGTSRMFLGGWPAETAAELSIEPIEIVQPSLVNYSLSTLEKMVRRNELSLEEAKNRLPAELYEKLLNALK